MAFNEDEVTVACGKWYLQKRSAFGRGIEFLLTFEEWWKIWQDSGHWHERGIRKHAYVMARFGDKGPYAIGNVKIISNSDNVKEAQLGRKHTTEHKREVALAHVGLKHKEEAKRKVSLARKGKPLSAEHKYKLSQAKLGKKLTILHRKHIVESKLRVSDWRAPC